MAATELEGNPAPGVRRRRLMLLPIALLGVIGLALAYLFLTARPEPSVPLGASASVPGGMASIGEIMPVENDGWEPDDNDDALDGAPSPGSHRVRLLVRITALEPGGVRLSSRDFSISGLGGERFRPVWESPSIADLEQGESLGATLIFEVPDKAVALVLEGPGTSRLSLGLSHHTG
ncbi:MAG: hypothetical protein U1D68_01015 [Arthrobacter sp.]|nr:hypothetical protein [Arthrobacter sp.]MDZ4351029.1 hypothetical protein [Arthrobacter sp.]